MIQALYVFLFFLGRSLEGRLKIKIYLRQYRCDKINVIFINIDSFSVLFCK